MVKFAFNMRTSAVSEMTEPILADNPERFVLFPIKYLQVWEMYKKAEASFWTG
jgi:ribonucleoside-diphosphate reductase subunit M2